MMMSDCSGEQKTPCDWMATSGYRWLLLGKTPPIEWFLCGEKTGELL